MDKFRLKINFKFYRLNGEENEAKAPLSPEQKLFLFMEVDTLARHLRF